MTPCDLKPAAFEIHAGTLFDRRVLTLECGSEAEAKAFIAALRQMLRLTSLGDRDFTMYILQLFKLAHNLPRLQLVTEALVYGMKSMMWVALLLLMFNYLFGLLGLILFRDNDPFHFGRLGRSFTTLWRVETLNDWETPMYVNVYGCAAYGYYGAAALHYNASSTAGQHSWSSSAVTPAQQVER